MMRRRSLSLAACGAVLLAAALAGVVAHARSPRSAVNIVAAPLPDVKTRYETVRFSNGFTVVVAEDHAAPVVQTSMWYRFGSLDERPDRVGLAHALEHMMFRGTPALSSGGLFHVFARLGATVNGTTSLDWTRYDIVVPSADIDLALSIEADRMAHAAISEADWRVERGAVLEELDAAKSEPVARLINAVRREAYRGSVFGLTPLGVRVNVEHANATDLREYYHRWYVPNNATLVVAGDVSPKQVISMARERFGALRPSALFRDRVAPPRFGHDRFVRVHGDYPFAVMDLAYAARGSTDPHYPASVVLTTVINNERSSIHRALVEDGLAFGYQAAADTSRAGGILHITAVLRPGVGAARARRAVEDAVGAYRRDGVPADLLSATKRASSASTIYDRDSVAGLAARVGWALAMTGSDPTSVARGIASVTPDALRAEFETLRAPVLGELVPSPGSRGTVRSTGPKGSVAIDDFSARRPDGPIVEPDWATRALSRPAALTSKVLPRRYVLSNGLRLYVQPVHENPTVFVQGSIDGSPAFDPAGKTGLGAFASLAVGYGGTRYDFALQHAVADSLAARFKFGRVFQARGMARDLPTLLDVLADGELHPALPSAYIDLVRDQAQQRINRRGENPDYLADRALASLLLPPNDPELREESAASVAAISTADLRGYIERYFRPDLTALVVVGDVDPEDVRRRVQAAFGAWRSNGTVLSADLPPIKVVRTAAAMIASDRSDIAVTMAGSAATRFDGDYLAATVANAVLGGDGDFDSRLFAELRQKRGLVYDVSSRLIAGRGRSRMEIRFSAAPRNVATAIALTEAAMRRLQSQPVDRGELDRVKTKMLAETYVAEASTQFIVGEVARIADYQLPPDYYRHLPVALQQVSARKVQRAAQRWFDPSRFVVVERGRVGALAKAGT